MRRMMACVAWLALLLFGAVLVSSAHIPYSTAAYSAEFEDAFNLDMVIFRIDRQDHYYNLDFS